MRGVGHTLKKLLFNHVLQPWALFSEVPLVWMKMIGGFLSLSLSRGTRFKIAEMRRMLFETFCLL